MRPSQTRIGSFGLTLAELIVAFFIILVLAGLLQPTFRAAEESKSPELNDLEQLIVAVKAFDTDYGCYPIDSAAHSKTDMVFGNPGGKHHNFEVMNVLRADGTDPGPNFRNAINTRQVVYMDVPPIKDPTNPRSGLGTGNETNSYGVTTPGEWYDPHGSPYMLFIDANYDGICDLGQVYSDVPSPHAAAVGASLGADKQIGTKGNGKYAGSDDVITGLGK